MTTAHRPTWYNALGADVDSRGTVKTKKVLSRQQPGHLRFKTRSGIDSTNKKSFKQLSNINKHELLEIKSLHKNENNKQLEDSIKDIISDHNSTTDIDIYPQDKDEEIQIQIKELVEN